MAPRKKAAKGTAQAASRAIVLAVSRAARDGKATAMGLAFAVAVAKAAQAMGAEWICPVCAGKPAAGWACAICAGRR